VLKLLQKSKTVFTFIPRFLLSLELYLIFAMVAVAH